MNIDIAGRSKTICRAELMFAAGFFAQYLMGTRLVKNLDIALFVKNMDGIADGFCHPYECGKNPRAFEISVNAKKQRHKILQILAHEMVHVKQYAKNELKSDNPLSASFAGKAYKITSSLEDYLNYPWEIEAFGREQGLYLMYQIFLKQEKIKFKRGKMYMRGKYVKLDKLSGKVN
jgi:hypothetical protein